ncbi:hypothetical protein [Dechloromonas denitrificans]|uniref:hypothetical protein n=1 Tax=Dechloromonas denitrificans TaxID=281362 RepID=UPI001CF9DE60|nr:hypothetical protein [Dechloromonas denitrificans]UCV06331.1 hypothetical protein KI615_12945 [Dechloromonas denitrificans]
MKILILIFYFLYCSVVFATENCSASQGGPDVMGVKVDLLEQFDFVASDQQHKKALILKNKNKFLIEFESCQDYRCRQSKIIEYAYWANLQGKKCHLKLDNISGEWVDKNESAIYKTLSLATYKGRPASYAYIVRENPPEGVEDAFGRWKLVGCEINTIEVESTNGRIFIQGMDLLILRAANGVLVLTDGENIYSYIRDAK